MKTEVYWITGPWSGQLAIAPRPRGGDWLEDEIHAWRGMGFNVVVSLLTPDEIAEFELEQEERWCQKDSIEFYAFPISDLDVPDSRQALAALIKKLDLALRAGKRVAVHCRQGIGRSGLVTAALLITAGEDVDTVWEHISQSRGRPVPDTDEQRAWVKTFDSAIVNAIR